MSKSIIASLVILAAVVTLSGCGKATTDTTTTDSSTGSVTAATDVFAIDACNKYIDVMKCMIEKSPSDVQTSSQDMMDKLLVAWKQLTPDQLQQACDATMKVMTEQKAAIEQMGCTVN